LECRDEIVEDVSMRCVKSALTTNQIRQEVATLLVRKLLGQ